MTKQAILVTSHYNRTHVLKAAAKSKIKILPKQLALSIPIKIEAKKSKTKNTDFVVIDNDKICADSLADFFRSKSFTVDVYYNPSKFLRKASKYRKNTKIFIDNNLCFDMTGIELAKTLHKDGYDKLYIFSGTEFKKNEVPNYLTVIMKGDMDALQHCFEI